MKVLRISPTAHKSKVNRVAEAIVTAIRTNVLKENEQLPSIAVFSRQYQVSRDTVEKAYGQLRLSGHIVASPGRGHYVAGKDVREVRILVFAQPGPSNDRHARFINALNSISGVRAELINRSPGTSRLGKHDYILVENAAVLEEF